MDASMSRIGLRLWGLCVFTSSVVSASILEPLVWLARVILVDALQPRWSLLVRWLSSSSFRCWGSARRDTFGCLLHDEYQGMSMSECGVVSAQQSKGSGEACPLLIGPWLHRCFGIHYLGNRQVVRNRMYSSPSVFDPVPADMVSGLSSFVQPTKVHCRHHSALWSSASGLPGFRAWVKVFCFHWYSLSIILDVSSLLRSFQVSSHWLPFQNILGKYFRFSSVLNLCCSWC
ncbi:hypothetical protein CLU79DRAFT_467339 [Phycomyces nitens]|nr:hypothetical protein CLU79DRAFT_467339 [Phycomyces nitens]